MTVPSLRQFADLALLLMRLTVGVVFISSGWKHAKDPVERGKVIETTGGGDMHCCSCSCVTRRLI